MTNTNIFKSYKQRLVRIDSRNSSFFLSILRPKRHIDLIKTSKIFDTSKNVLNEINNFNKITINKPIFNKSQLEKAFLAIDYQEEVKKLIPSIEKIDFIKFEKINEDGLEKESLNAFLSQTINKYDNLLARELKLFSGVDKEAKNILRTIGKDDLYLGFPFVEGKFESNREFRGPLILHRVNINKTNSGYTIDIIEGGKIINPVFLLSHISESSMKHKKFDYELSDDVKDYVNYTVKYLEKEGIKLKNDNSSSGIEIESITKKAYKEKYNSIIGEFEIKNYCVLGLFPVSDRNIYNDIDYLEKEKSELPESLNQFLSGYKRYEELSDNEEIPKEKEIKYISPVDSSQRIVIKNALTNSLVIEGPPGTGKSQTIVNLIVNLLLQDKKVLVVSEKLAAIDVIYNRLGRLKENTLIIKDYLRNKEDFFRQIRDTEKTRFSYYRDSYNNEIDSNIQKYFDYFKIINSEYIKDKKFHEVIKIIDENKDKKEFNKHNDFLIKYLEGFTDLNLLSTHVREILNEDKITLINKHQKMMSNNLFDLFKVEEILFFHEQLNDNYSKEQIEYNYHLINNQQKNIEFDPVNPIKKPSGVKAKSFKYLEVDRHINEVYERIIKHEEALKQINTLKNDDIKNNLNLIKLLLRWNNLSNKERQVEIKVAFNSSYKYGFIAKLFHKKAKLGSREQEVYDYIDNYYEMIDLKQIKEVYENFFPSDIFVSSIFLNEDNQDRSKEKLLKIYFSEDLINFDNRSYDKKYLMLKESKLIIDYEILNQFKNLSKKDIELIKLYEVERFDIEELINYFNYLIIGTDKVKEVTKVIKYFQEKEYNNITNLIDDKYKEVEKYSYQYVKNQIESTFKRKNTVYNEYVGGLLHNASLQRKKAIKVMFDLFLRPLLTIYPVMLMTPEVVSSVFPMIEEIFDYVIFDEASQMFIERAVPSIYRAQRVIVAGDSQQLKPSSIFQTRIAEDDDIYYEEDITNEELLAFDKESLLEMSKSKYNSKMLKYHYRSEHKELIEFSSAAFYDNELIFSSMNETATFKTPIKVIEVDGIWADERVNEAEAKEVINLVQLLLKKRKNNETIGIITFNITQKELIESMLEELDNQQVTAEMQRVHPDTGDDEALFVKNIENVQGDERDIIIFSIGYARNKNKRLNTHFGSLSQAGGENRLNVAITRAKKRIYIVKSFNSSELYIANKENVGAVRFKQYLEFVEYVSEQYKSKLPKEKQAFIDKKEGLLNSITSSVNIYETSELEYGFDSPFEEDFYHQIKALLPDKYLIKNQVNVGGYLIDFGIFDQETEKYILGVECDGYSYHSKPEDIEKDFFRQKYLESRGWNIHRVISTNWFNDKKKEIEELILVLDNLVK